MSDAFNEDENPAFREFLSKFLGEDAAEEALRSMRAQGIDPSTLGAGMPDINVDAMLGQFRHLLNTSTGPVNWSMAHDLAKQTTYQGGDPMVTAAEAARARQAMSIADLWLDAVTEFSPGQVERATWTRSGWIDHTTDTWKRICEPVAANVSRALSDALAQQFGELGGAEDAQMAAMLPGGIPALLGQAEEMMPKLASMVFATQMGQALSALAKECFGSTDIGLPLGPAGTTALVPHNVTLFADGLDAPFEEVLQFLAVRECAHQRLFASVPWLAGDLIHAVESYSGEIAIDTEAIAEAARSMDPANLNSMDSAMAAGVFAQSHSPKQAAALERLETLLALVEGWVETVTARACAPYLPHADNLREMMRRRRASGGPAEAVLGNLIGLTLRPKRSRGAATLFALVEAEKGREGREELWRHPDFIPSAQDLDEPESYLLVREAGTDEVDALDAEFAQLLEGTLGWAEGLSPEDDPEAERLREAGFDMPERSGATQEAEAHDDATSDASTPEDEGSGSDGLGGQTPGNSEPDESEPGNPEGA